MLIGFVSEARYVCACPTCRLNSCATAGDSRAEHGTRRASRYELNAR